jgi:tetratricopeptide (TPR) repeat protein
MIPRLLAISLLVGALGCGGSRDQKRAEPTAVESPTQAEASLPAPMLPHNAGRFAPARVALAEGAAVDGKHLTDTDTCAKCHADIAEQWRTSAHANASFSNPIYRVSIERFRKASGNHASRFCGGCHDVALLVDGAMAKTVAPTDARAHAGITCRTCHGIESVRADGNGSYTIGSRPIPIPVKGVRGSVQRHRKAAGRGTIGARLCIGCHRAFLGTGSGHPNHLPGLDDATAWASSAYSGSGAGRVDAVTKADCIGCHMKREKATRDLAASGGKVASHRFLGGHTWLAAMRKDPDNLARVRAFLRGVASIDIAAITDHEGRTTLLARGAPVKPGHPLTADVVIRNRGVGHRFPSGVLDAQDTWVELTVRDAGGRTIARAGGDHARTGNDPSAHVLRALVADQKGKPLLEREVARFRGTIVNHTVAPRDAVAVRYRFEVPEGARLPLRLHARLLHRTRNLALQRAACAATRDRRGRAFARVSRRYGRHVDPCVTQPITEIASTQTVIGNGWKNVAAPEIRPRWERLYEHGMALLHSVQERVGEAGPSLSAALKAAPDDHARAAVMTALGQLAGKLGRTTDALGWLDHAARLAPRAAAIPLAKAAALTRVWRWREAIAPLRRAASLAPKNIGVWTKLAVALGSAGDDRDALEAAQSGLRILPREPNALRVQALSLSALGAPREYSAHALDAYARFRSPDVAPHLRISCAARSPDCARERDPVHAHLAR